MAVIAAPDTTSAGPEPPSIQSRAGEQGIWSYLPEPRHGPSLRLYSHSDRDANDSTVCHFIDMTHNSKVT